MITKPSRDRLNAWVMFRLLLIPSTGLSSKMEPYHSYHIMLKFMVALRVQRWRSHAAPKCRNITCQSQWRRCGSATITISHRHGNQSRPSHPSLPHSKYCKARARERWLFSDCNKQVPDRIRLLQKKKRLAYLPRAFFIGFPSPLGYHPVCGTVAP